MAQAAKAKPLGKARPKAAAPVVKAKMPHPVGAFTLKVMAASVPVLLYTAAREEKIELHQYHSECNHPIKQLGMFCPTCAGLSDKQDATALDQGLALEEIRLSKDDIYKGFDAAGKIIPITEEEIEAAKPESGKVLEILEFVDADSVDAISFDASYYLAPDSSAGVRALGVFSVFRTAMENDNILGVARMVKGKHEYVAFIRPYGDGMILYTAFLADEVRPMVFPELPAPKASEVDAVRKLINAMRADWKPEKYIDSYRENINALIAAKREGAPVPEVERKPAASTGEDFMATLQASIEIAKAKKRA